MSEMKELPGPGNATVRSLERFPIHTRDTEATQSAWRMEIESDAGRGAIMLIDLSEGQAIYRGEGAFLGWPQDRLAAVFNRLRATPDGPPFELQQLG
jgi:hypothetical protein